MFIGQGRIYLLLGTCYILCMDLDGFLTNVFQPMVWVFDPWFSNSIFGIGVLKVSKDLILYCKHSI